MVIKEKHIKAELAKEVGVFNASPVSSASTLRLLSHTKRLLQDICTNSVTVSPSRQPPVFAASVLRAVRSYSRLCIVIPLRFLNTSVEDIIATFLSCLQTLYTLLPVRSTQPCREVIGLVQLLPSLVSDAIIFFPSTPQLGLVLKALCRITLRLCSRGWLTEVWIGAG